MSSPEVGHFDHSQFLQGLSPDRLIGQLEKMANNSTHALCIGKNDTCHKRIRLVSTKDVEKLKEEIKSGAVVNALQIFGNQIKEGKFIFEEHFDTSDKKINAYAPKEIAEKIEKQELALHDKNHHIHPYHTVQEINQDHLHEIAKTMQQTLKLDEMTPPAAPHSDAETTEKAPEVKEPKQEAKSTAAVIPAPTTEVPAPKKKPAKIQEKALEEEREKERVLEKETKTELERSQVVTEKEEAKQEERIEVAKQENETVEQELSQELPPNQSQDTAP
jgi:hypothetical protein